MILNMLLKEGLIRKMTFEQTQDEETSPVTEEKGFRRENGSPRAIRQEGAFCLQDLATYSRTPILQGLGLSLWIRWESVGRYWAEEQSALTHIGTNRSGCHGLCRDKSGSRENSEGITAVTQGDVGAGGEDWILDISWKWNQQNFLVG